MRHATEALGDFAESPQNRLYIIVFIGPVIWRQTRGHQEGVVEHKGIGFNVVQSVRRGHYVWTTQTDPPKCAEAPGKDVAIKNAQRSIDIWLRAAKRTEQPQ